MGSDASKEYQLEEKVEIVSSTVWNLYKATRIPLAKNSQPRGPSDGGPVSVFVYDDDRFVENAAKYLKVLRHPCIVRFHAFITCGSDEFWLITERVTPLENLLDSLSPLEICSGLYNITEALTFLHDSGGLCHNNINISSVFVTDDGTWKLGAMECVCKFNDATPSFLLEHKPLRLDKIIAPEERAGNLQPNSGFSRDVYSFGVFAEYVMEFVSGLDEKSVPFNRIIEDELKNESPQKRPKISNLLEDPLFRNEFIEISNFLKRITIKSDEEKKAFFQEIVQKLFALPQKLIAVRLTRLLLSRFVVLDPTACELLIPHLLTPDDSANEKQPGRCFRPDRINPILSETLFRRYVVPELFKIFHVRDVHVRTVLLRHFHRYVRMFDEASLSETIFPQILLSVRDANDELVMLSLRAIADLVPLLGADAIIGLNRAKLFYSGKPKQSVVVNGHTGIAVVANGKCSNSEEPVSVGAAAVDHSKEAERQRKREEARRRMEERRRKKENDKRTPVSSPQLEPADHRSPNWCQESTNLNPVQQESYNDNTRTEPEENSSGLLPEQLEFVEERITDNFNSSYNEKLESLRERSISYDRTDSEIEQEIENELQTLETNAKNLQIGIEDPKLSALPNKVDWSDVPVLQNKYSTEKSLRGALKLVVPEHRIHEKVDPNTLETGLPISPGMTKEFTNSDDWNEAGWEEVSSKNTTPEKPTPPMKKSTSSKSNPKLVSRSNPTPLQNQPLGAGYDIKLVDIKTPPTVEEFDYFADMAPKIKPAGDNLLGILGGKVESTFGMKTTSVNSGTHHSFNMIDVMDMPENGGSGWGDDLDWNIDGH